MFMHALRGDYEGMFDKYLDSHMAAEGIGPSIAEKVKAEVKELASLDGKLVEIVRGYMVGSLPEDYLKQLSRIVDKHKQKQ